MVLEKVIFTSAGIIDECLGRFLKYTMTLKQQAADR